MTRHRPLVAFALAFLVCTLAGCGNKPAHDGGTGSSDGPGPSASAGPSDPKGLIDQHCAKCHQSRGGGEGGRGKGMKGPDLSHVGAEHDAAWIADHIRNPRSHKPQSRMPEFERELKPEEIRAIADYLAGLK